MYSFKIVARILYKMETLIFSQRLMTYLTSLSERSEYQSGWLNPPNSMRLKNITYPLTSCSICTRMKKVKEKYVVSKFSSAALAKNLWLLEKKKYFDLKFFNLCSKHDKYVTIFLLYSQRNRTNCKFHFKKEEIINLRLQRCCHISFFFRRMKKVFLNEWAPVQR